MDLWLFFLCWDVLAVSPRPEPSLADLAGAAVPFPTWRKAPTPVRMLTGVKGKPGGKKLGKKLGKKIENEEEKNLYLVGMF